MLSVIQVSSSCGDTSFGGRMSESEAPTSSTNFSTLPSEFDPMPGDLACERCGASPAFHGIDVVSAGFVMYYAKTESESTLCRDHLKRKAWENYLVTSILGWPGLHIIYWPRAIWLATKRLRPIVGDSTSRMLLAAPILVVGIAISALTYVQFFMYGDQ